MSTTTVKLLARGAGRIPGLRRLPAGKLLALGEVALLAQRHLARLEPDERRRLIALVRQGRGRRAKLSESERHELSGLLAKVEPRRLAGLAADAFSPFPLPKRIVNGAKRR